MKRNAIKQLRAARMRALADGTAQPVAFGWWDDPELTTVDGSPFQIYFNDMIDDWFGVSAAMVVSALLDADGRDVLVHLNSPGGMYTEGLAIHSAFKQYSGNVTFRIAGMAASAASFVMLSGNRIEITEGSLVMIHDAWDMTVGDASEHRKTADLLDKVSNSIAGMYAGKGGGEVAGWRALMETETWYAGQEAVDAGLVDTLADIDDAPPIGDPGNAALNREWSSVFASAPGPSRPAALSQPKQLIDKQALATAVAEQNTDSGQPAATAPVDQPAPFDWMAFRNDLLRGVRS